MAALLTLIILGLSLLCAFGVIFLFSRKEQETKRKLKAEEELQRLTSVDKDKLIAILGSLTDGIVLFDNTDSVSFINRSAKRYLNIPTDQPTFSDILNQFPQPIHLTEKLREVFSYNRMVSLSEVTVRERTFRVFINPVQQNEKIPNDGYEHHVVGATLLLQDLTHEVQVEKMKEDFTHMIIHELRAPLTAIKDAASLLDTESISADDKKPLLKMIHDQAKILLTQVSTILDAGKIESGKFTIQKTQGDIGKIVEGEVSFFLPEAQKKQITLVAEIGNNLPQLSFDAVRITQVINNLISNGLKYTNPGGMIKVTADSKNDQATNQPEAVCISVSDTGIGIPEEKQQLLFTKYSDIGNDTSGKNSGQSTGLGLYIAKGIVDAHGGTLTLQSEPNKGTTFTICLPLRDEESTNQPLVASLRSHPGSTLPLINN